MTSPYSGIFGFGQPNYDNFAGMFGGPGGAPANNDFNFGGFLPAGAGAAEDTSFFDKIGGLEGLGQIAKGLASLGSMYTAFRGLNLAEDQFDFQKGAYRENLANQKKTYNTSLRDRIRSRYNTEGRSTSAAQSYLDKYSL